MRKVVHVVHHMRIGGVENAVLSHLKNSSNNYWVLCLDDYDVDFVGKCEGNLLYSKRKGLSKFFDLYFILRSFDADVIVSSLWRSHLFVFFVNLFLGKVWLSFFHSAHFFHRPDKFFSLLALRFSHKILVDSEATGSFLGGFISDREYNVVDFTFPIIGQRSVYSSKKNVFNFFGRIIPEKNLKYMIDVFALVCQRYPFPLHVYGVGEQLCSVKEYVRHLELEGVVFFHGSVSPDEVGIILNESKYYIQTSIIEGRSISISQAMNYGNVVFSSSVGGVSEYLSENFNGIVLPLNNARLAASLIVNILDDSKEQERLSYNAQRTFDCCSGFTSSFDSFINS